MAVTLELHWPNCELSRLLDSGWLEAISGLPVRRIGGHHSLVRTLVLLAFVEDEPVGVAVCFFELSTFKTRPLLNIHDLAVLPQYRGRV